MPTLKVSHLWFTVADHHHGNSAHIFRLESSYWGIIVKPVYVCMTRLGDRMGAALSKISARCYVL